MEYYLITQELFVEYLAKEAQKKEAIKTEVSYKSLCKCMYILTTLWAMAI